MFFVESYLDAPLLLVRNVSQVLHDSQFVLFYVSAEYNSRTRNMMLRWNMLRNGRIYRLLDNQRFLYTSRMWVKKHNISVVIRDQHIA
jgi:hypothetical protein